MKRSRLQETSMEVTVGAFMFMVLLALGFFTIVLSRESMFSKSYKLEVLFDNVRGLREGDNVFLRGVDVGKIKMMQIREDGVHVLVTLEQEAVLRSDYKIEILPSSVLGGRYLNIFEGSPDFGLIGAGTVITGIPPVDLIDEATKVAQIVKKALDEGGILENLKVTMAEVRLITEKLAKGEGTLGKLLVDDTVYNDLQKIANNLRDVSDRLAQGEGTLGKLMSKDDTLYADISAAAESLKHISQSVEKGEGTLGKLVTDDQLYVEARLLLNEVRAAIDDLRETTPVATFASVFFGAF